MATNPMQRKSRNTFLLGMFIMLIITILILALLYTQVIKKQEEKLKNYEMQVAKVCVITKEVKSGEALENGVNYTIKKVATNGVPTGALTDTTYMTVFDSFSFTDQDGRKIYLHLADANDNEQYYYLESKDQKLYRSMYDEVSKENKEQLVADGINVNDKIYYKKDGANVEITVNQNAIVAKVDLPVGTVLTSQLLNRVDEITTNDLRKEEYNVVSLPVDLVSGEYIDIRFTLPNGQNYIVVSKKKVKIPSSNGQYLPDTIQINLTEEEILKMSCAIVENFKMAGSKLYASRYTEAGMQKAADVTYQPNDYVVTLVKNDKNIVQSAIKGLNGRTLKDIDSAVSKYGTEEDVTSKTETSITSTLEQRKNYLQSIPVIE